MEYQTIEFQKQDRVARITLNRPEALNALSADLLNDLRCAFAAVRNDAEVKALVITGKGKAFCAGADLKGIDRFFEEFHLFREYLDHFDSTILELEELPLVTIAVAQGQTFAGGLELLLACDLAIIDEEAPIGDQHMNFGLMGGPVNVQLPRRIGYQRALHLLYTGAWILGKEAEAIGLVYKAVPKDKLEEELEKILAQVRDRSRDAFIHIKKAVKYGTLLPLRDGFEYCGLQALTYFSTSDKPRQGVRAFVEKKGRPKF